MNNPHFCPPIFRQPVWRKSLLEISCGVIFALAGPATFAQDSRPGSPDSPPPAQVAPAASPLVTWLESLDKAQEQARARRVPILVICGAEWCGPCKMLEKEIENPVVQRQLGNWLPVHLDVDKEPATARRLNAAAIPRLVILTPDGREVSSEVGFMSAAMLAAWLESSFPDAQQAYVPELSETGPPTIPQVLRIVKEFRRRDSTLREAAINRLRPHPEPAAMLVLARMTKGTLSERLCARELLQGWGAPVADLDPWSPESFTTEKLTSLDDWAKARNFQSLPEGDQPSAEVSLEVDRLLRSMLTADPAAAAALREQLVRLGPPALSQLKEALAEDRTDAERSRLLAAKLRFAAPAELVVSWPGGLERLAAATLPERIKAMEELGERAGAAEENLLLELFTDPAPLIRELALQTLRKVSGVSSETALTRLLHDSDANVRAAVLKQLSENPSASLVPVIAAYVKQESDPDLVVHAARLLREVTNQSSLDVLASLAEHASWRVRADAVEGMNEILKGERELALANWPTLDPLYVKLLKDEDAFVVARTLQGLQTLGRKSAVEPMLQAATDHPELAAEVVEALTTSSHLREHAAEPLRRFLTHELETVRLAAIVGLVTSEKADAAKDIQALISDPSPAVRAGLINALQRQVQMEVELAVNRGQVSDEVDEPRPTGFLGMLGRLFGQDAPAPAVPVPSVPVVSEPEDAALLELRTKDSLPEWLRELRPALRGMADDPDPSVKFAALRILTAMGDEERFAPFLELVRSRDDIRAAAEILSCLPWSERLPLFQKLVGLSTSHSDLDGIVYHFADRAHSQAAAEVWLLLARADAEEHLASSISERLVPLYLGSHYYDIERVPKAKKDAAAADCEKYFSSGTRWQRIVALGLLSQVHPGRAVAAALPVFEDPARPMEQRVDALRVLLFCEEKSSAQQRAVAALGQTSPELLEPALAYLTLGETEARTLTGGISLGSPYAFRMSSFRSSSSTPEPLDAPENADVARLLPLLAKTGPVAAQAGYLLALLGEPKGLPALLAQWEKDRQHPSYQRLTYRAIAALNDSERVPVLDAIYSKLAQEKDTSGIKEFYWTIRTMTGGPVLALRQKIRSEQGAEALR